MFCYVKGKTRKKTVKAFWIQRTSKGTLFSTYRHIIGPWMFNCLCKKASGNQSNQYIFSKKMRKKRHLKVGNGKEKKCWQTRKRMLQLKTETQCLVTAKKTVKVRYFKKLSEFQWWKSIRRSQTLSVRDTEIPKYPMLQFILRPNVRSINQISNAGMPILHSRNCY